MKKTIKIITTLTTITLLSSCSNWNPKDNPLENGAKKFSGFFDKISNKTKYSSLSNNYEHNREIYYTEELNKFLESNYKTKEISGSNNIFVVEKELRNSSDKNDSPNEIHAKLANYCESNKANFPKFHKVVGDKNTITQVIHYPIKEQRIFEYKFQHKGVGKYIGEFTCFKEKKGVIWRVSINPEFEKIGNREIAFIKIMQQVVGNYRGNKTEGKLVW